MCVYNIFYILCILTTQTIFADSFNSTVNNHYNVREEEQNT